ncbi:hypothetical protein HAX54_004306 [Datura stramonium]|uniref:ubiquitinyl hydrolase 1 n=1 Tax=Datura stramonium TaxID=4076 RepID=A0ABS8T928_DATST|nr:hypothetical protein [Datura stramonium]
MEGVSNGGMLYHEVQESKLCAVHCVNTVLQGPFFSEFDLAAVASDLDRTERQMMVQGSGDFVPEESHNVSLDGDFSIQVVTSALHCGPLAAHLGFFMRFMLIELVDDPEFSHEGVRLPVLYCL